MSKLYSNPFIWGTPVSGNRYVSRSEEETQIVTCLEKEQRIILTGNRGTGKTSMVQRVLAKYPGESIYIDLSFVVDASSMVSLLAKHIRRSIPLFKEDARLRPNPDGTVSGSLSELFEILNTYIEEYEKKVVIVWDEFQHILKLKENLLTDIKKGINGKSALMTVLISHREDLMRDAFMKKGERALPKSCHVELGNIDAASFKTFLTNYFRRMGLNDFDLPDSVLKFTGGHAHLTQRFASAVAGCWLEGTTTRLKDRAMKRLLNEEDANFTALWDGFGVNEKRLLLGLAHGFSRPTELSFIDRFGLSATSTAHNTVLKLVREGWLVNRDEGYYIYDPLFLSWLKSRNDM